MVDEIRYWLYICLNPECQNTRGSFFRDAEGVICCDCCGRAAQAINVPEPDVPEADLVDVELRMRARELKWLTHREAEQWPGPVAFEYSCFRNIMLEGNIEAACWKLVNFVEVLVTYLYCATAEVILPRAGTTTLGKKLHFVCHNTLGGSLSRLLESTLWSINSWRNNTGIGHGALIQDKSQYVDRLIELTDMLNGALPDFSSFLDKHGLSLYDRSGKKITGSLYVFSLPAGENEPLTCRPGITLANYPVVVLGYQFDGTDVYFINPQKDSLQYKNYSKNRVKYLSVSTRGVDWGKDLWQVSLLNEGEREQWLDVLKNRLGEVTEYEEINNMLLNFGEQFQKRGMIQEAKAILELIEENRLLEKSGKKQQEYVLRKTVLEYCLSLAGDGSNELDDKIGELFERVEEELAGLKYKILFLLVKGWHYGVYGREKEALRLFEETMVHITRLKEKKPYSALLYELELEKNRLYIISRLQGDKTTVDNWTLQTACLSLLRKASALYKKNPENGRVVDILGFACNLYGDFSIDRVSPAITDEGIKQQIVALNRHGEKVRKRMWEKYPDDVWALRGYVWSVHCRARLEWKLNGDEKRAIEILEEATQCRLNGENKFPDDLGIKEDLVHNYVNCGELQRKKRYLVNAQKRIDFIRKREGDSPRVSELQKLVNEITKRLES